MGVTYIPGWGQQIQPAIQALSGLIPKLINPHRDFQEQVRVMIAQDPRRMQQLVDMERMNPGTLKAMGLGPLAGMTGGMQQSADSILQQRAQGVVAGGQSAIDQADSYMRDYLSAAFKIETPEDAAQKAAQTRSYNTQANENEARTQQLQTTTTLAKQEADREAQRIQAVTEIRGRYKDFGQLYQAFNSTGLKPEEQKLLMEDKPTADALKFEYDKTQDAARAEREKLELEYEKQRIGISWRQLRLSEEKEKKAEDDSKFFSLFQKSGISIEGWKALNQPGGRQKAQELLDLKNKNYAAYQQQVGSNPVLADMTDAYVHNLGQSEDKKRKDANVYTTQIDKIKNEIGRRMSSNVFQKQGMGETKAFFESKAGDLNRALENLELVTGRDIPFRYESVVTDKHMVGKDDQAIVAIGNKGGKPYKLTPTQEGELLGGLMEQPEPDRGYNEQNVNNFLPEIAKDKRPAEQIISDLAKVVQAGRLTTAEVDTIIRRAGLKPTEKQPNRNTGQPYGPPAPQRSASKVEAPKPKSAPAKQESKPIEPGELFKLNARGTRLQSIRRELEEAQAALARIPVPYKIARDSAEARIDKLRKELAALEK